MAEQKEHPGKISYGQPDYALLRPILDTWLEEWGVKETFFALGEPMLQAAEYKRLWQQLLEQIARALGIDEATRQSVKHPLKEKLITYLQHHAISFSDEEQSIILEHLLKSLVSVC